MYTDAKRGDMRICIDFSNIFLYAIFTSFTPIFLHSFPKFSLVHARFLCYTKGTEISAFHLFNIFSLATPTKN